MSTSGELGERWVSGWLDPSALREHTPDGSWSLNALLVEAARLEPFSQSALDALRVEETPLCVLPHSDPEYGELYQPCSIGSLRGDLVQLFPLSGTPLLDPEVPLPLAGEWWVEQSRVRLLGTDLCALQTYTIGPRDHIRAFELLPQDDHILRLTSTGRVFGLSRDGVLNPLLPPNNCENSDWARLISVWRRLQLTATMVSVQDSCDGLFRLNQDSRSRQRPASLRQALRAVRPKPLRTRPGVDSIPAPDYATATGVATESLPQHASLLYNFVQA